MSLSPCEFSNQTMTFAKCKKARVVQWLFGKMIKFFVFRIENLTNKTIFINKSSYGISIDNFSLPKMNEICLLSLSIHGYVPGEFFDQPLEPVSKYCMQSRKRDTLTSINQKHSRAEKSNKGP